MPKRIQINEQVTVGPQPSDQQLRQLQQEGFKSVVNFRTEGEERQPLSPAEEGEQVRSAGMDYLHLPVSMKSISSEQVDYFRERFADLPKPVFAHCQGGKRAGAMVMMNVGIEAGLSGEQTLEQAGELGFECDQPELRDFVCRYVDRHGGSS